MRRNTKWLFTVNPGIEDIAANEIRNEIGGNIKYNNMAGHVIAELDNDISYESIYRLRTINRAIKIIWEGVAERSIHYLAKLKNILLKELDSIIEYITPEISFAVRSERIGIHEYTSMDLSRVLGDVVIDIISKKYSKRPQVNLRAPDVIVYAFLRENKLVIGIQYTGPWSLHRRSYRIYDHPAALKPTLATAMLYLVGTKDKSIIVDPMCGGGTIPIEAALLHEDAYILGLDINPVHIKGSMKNAVAAGVFHRTIFRVWDARKLHELGLDIDYVVTNPPYGIRYGSPTAIKRLYRKFIFSLEKALAVNGKVAIITTEYAYLHKIIEYSQLKIVHERTVAHGGLYPHIIILEKKS